MQLHEHRAIARIDYIRLLLWIVALAIPTGVVTVVYLGIYHEGENLYHELAATMGAPVWLFTILVATLGGLLVGLGLRFLGEHRSEDDKLDRQIAEGRAPYKGMGWLLLISLIGLISGASVGPEGPLAHAAAGAGTWLAEKRKYSAEQSRLLSLGNVSAVFGAFLGTPLSAAFMTLEFTRQLTVPIYANMIATTVAALFGALIMFAISHAPPTGIDSYPIEGTFTAIGIFWAVVLGFLGLGWAFVFKLIFVSTQRITTRLDRYPLLKPTLGGLFFGLVGAWMPLTLFSGQYGMGEVLETGAELGVVVLLLLAVLKLITLSVCLSTGFPGGFVFPVFFSASALGYAIHLMFPIIPLPVSIVGTLAGVGGGVMRMPFAVILLLTVVSNPGLLPVSVIAALTSFMTASMLDAGSARRAMEEAQADMRDIYMEESQPDQAD